VLAVRPVTERGRRINLPDDGRTPGAGGYVGPHVE
jgi:hypothetical protein